MDVHDHSYGAMSPSVCRQEVVGDTKQDEWRVGRRVVELGVLVEGLKACFLCSQPLHLENCVEETKFGLAYMLKIKCDYADCGLINENTNRKATQD